MVVEFSVLGSLFARRGSKAGFARMSDQAAEHEGTPIKSATSPDLPATHSIAPNQWSPRMILKAIVDDQVYTLKVPEQILQSGEEFFDQLDRDMDQGWQMSREWVDRPNQLQRCQIIADKLLSALEKENERLGMMMAGYICARLPQVDAVEFDLQGEMQHHQFRFRDASSDTAVGTAPEQTAATRMQPEPTPTAASTNNALPA
jgi:hypothetical protein